MLNMDCWWVRSVLAALAAMPALPLVAQDYPVKVVRMVVPFPAGGSTDVLARMVSQKMTETLGQNFIVDNRPGATGTIAGAMVAKAPPDGYTLIMHSTSSYTSGYLYRKISYEPARAFAPVIRAAISGLYIVSIPSLPARNIKEMVALAKKRPKELAYATVGFGSAAHLGAEMFNAAAGIKTIPVAYKGSAPALVALASGEVGFTVLNILDPQPFVKQGKLRSMAVTSAKRSPALPDVPTLMESGINVEAYLWTGLFATMGTPAAAIHKLNAAISRYITEPQTNSWLMSNVGGEFALHTPEQFAKFLVSDTALWLKIARDINFALD